MGSPGGAHAPADVAPLRHRDDLQGLRAVAVLIVALGHAGVAFLAGGYVGVDVFFVLSGFLITSLLLSGAAKHGRISLPEFYRRRARRILPAAALALVVTDVVAYQLLNFVRAKETVVDSLWAAAFTANVHFGHENADYFARQRPPSPIQQFWTLSVEEQFYVIWPLLLALALFGLLVWRRRHGEVTVGALHRALLVISVAGALSLMWSIQSTSSEPQTAYFSTFTRIWELALGAALAIAAPQLGRLPGLARMPLGWIGLGAIALAAVLYSSSTPFPGYAALLPTVGAALFIGAGISGTGRLGAGRLLSLAPFRFVGDRSYAFYLWHWPAIVIASEYAGRTLSVGVNLLVLAGAFALSCITYAVFENPIRRMQGRRAGLVLWPASAALVAACALPMLASIGNTEANIAKASASVHPARIPASVSTQRRAPLSVVVKAVKAARAGKPIPWPLKPAVSHVESDRYAFPSSRCRPNLNQSSSDVCRLGDVHSGKSILVFGDSHAINWMPPLLRMAKKDHWLVLPVIKPSCVPKKWTTPGYDVCNAWFRWAMKQARSRKPQVAFIAGKWSNTRQKAVVPMMKATIRELSSVAASVVVVGDPPEEKQSPPDCLLASNATMKTCTVKARKVDLTTDTAVAKASSKLGAGFVYTRGWFCAKPKHSKKTYCPIVINKTITRSDTNHVSKTYAKELSGRFRTAFRQALFS
jgi:peptidoglycan/LPS O-acetylase OafA/YrhL